jgi:GNAT superfamily N-acetyltransferase
LTHELCEGAYLVSTDPSRIDLDRVRAFLTRSYWAEGIPRETVARSIEHSIPFGLYDGREQIGFARVVTDRATFAWLADVYVEEGHRGKGLGKLLMCAVMAHPELQSLRRWMLGTRDAHGLYRQFGFSELARPERWMDKHDPDVYTRPARGV